MKRPTATALIWVFVALCALVDCKKTPVAGPGPVCAVSVVELGGIVAPGEEQLVVGWLTGPITTGQFHMLEDAKPTRLDLSDVDEVWAPGFSGVFRFMPNAARDPRDPVPPGNPPVAEEFQATGVKWAPIVPPSIVGATFNRVSATHLAGSLRVCYTQVNGVPRLAIPSPTSGSGWSVGDIELWGTEPHPLGPLEDPNAPKIPGAGNVGSFVDIACAGAETPPPGGTTPNELHVCGVTDDGHLWHTIFNGTTWLPFGDVENVISDIGAVLAVDCVADGRQLHLVALAKTNSGYVLKHTIRSANGQWRPWEDILQSSTGGPWPQGSAVPINDVAIAYCDATGPQPVNGANEPRRLTIAWVDDHNLTMVQRSSYIVNWQAGWTPSQISPAISVAPRPNGVLERVGLSQRPFPPQ